jgi:tetratricopeptide (TPR) repeat protein
MMSENNFKVGEMGKQYSVSTFYRKYGRIFFILHFALGRTDLAVKQYLKAIEIEPNHTVALVNAARTLRSMKHMKKAETLYKRYVLATRNAI